MDGTQQCGGVWCDVMRLLLSVPSGYLGCGEGAVALCCRAVRCGAVRCRFGAMRCDVSRPAAFAWQRTTAVFISRDLLQCYR